MVKKRLGPGAKSAPEKKAPQEPQDTGTAPPPPPASTPQGAGGSQESPAEGDTTDRPKGRLGKKGGDA